MHCKEPLRQTLPLLREGYEVGLEIGDVAFSMYNAVLDCLYSYFAGLELAKIASTIESYSKVLARFKQDSLLTYLRRLQQVTINLMERVETPDRLLGTHYNEKYFLPIHLEANDRSHLYYTYLDKLILSYLFEDFLQALENASQTELYLGGATGTYAIPIFYFYDSLVRVQLYQSVSFSEQEPLLCKVISNQEKMQRWAHSAPSNFQHKYDLVEAEKSRVLGYTDEAMSLYEQAITGAEDNQFLQEEALAYELAAKFYLTRKMKRIAQTYMKEAHYCYERWGAIAKVKDLETRYPQLLPQSSNVVSTPVRTTTGTTSSTSHTALDLATVMKAAQSISSEIELERLLRSLMQILIENAGAQTGCLVLKKLRRMGDRSCLRTQ